MTDDFSVFWQNDERARTLFYELLERSERAAYDDDFLARLAAYREAECLLRGGHGCTKCGHIRRTLSPPSRGRRGGDRLRQAFLAPTRREPCRMGCAHPFL